MSVFLSYRRTDSAYALWIYPWLIQWFGREQVFWDRKDIDPGQDFAEVIEKQIRSSRAFVALVSNNWLSATDDEGHRRIDSPEDWIRRETVLALSEEILVIPVLVGGIKPPGVEDLPAELQRVAKLQMLSMAEMSLSRSAAREPGERHSRQRSETSARATRRPCGSSAEPAVCSGGRSSGFRSEPSS